MQFAEGARGRVKARPGRVEQRTRKAARELAKKPDLRDVVDALYESLREGRRTKRLIRFA